MDYIHGSPGRGNGAVDGDCSREDGYPFSCHPDHGRYERARAIAGATRVPTILSFVILSASPLLEAESSSAWPWPCLSPSVIGETMDAGRRNPTSCLSLTRTRGRIGSQARLPAERRTEGSAQIGVFRCEPVPSGVRRDLYGIMLWQIPVRCSEASGTIFTVSGCQTGACGL